MLSGLENTAIGPIASELERLGAEHGADGLAALLGYLGAAGVLGYLMLRAARAPARLAWLLLTLPFRGRVPEMARDLEQLLGETARWEVRDRGQAGEKVACSRPPVTVQTADHSRDPMTVQAWVGHAAVDEHLGAGGCKRVRRAAERCRNAILAAEKEARRRAAARELEGD